jgi:hypothetical protein
MTNLNQKTLVNKDFQRAVKTLRRILPKLSFGLLIGTYLISALIMGLFHAENATSPAFYVAAFAVPLAIQAGRGTLVFFFQLNPARIQSRFSMAIVAATALLGLSVWEAVLILEPYGLSWMVSVCTLMLIGYIIEIMILKETMFATQLELYQNKDQWKELKDFYIAREQFQNFMDALHDGQVPDSKYLPTSTSSPDLRSQSEGGQVKKKIRSNQGEIPFHPTQESDPHQLTLGNGNKPFEFDLNGHSNGNGSHKDA